MLLSANANPDLQNSNGWSALHHATLAGNPKAIECLIENNASLNLRSHIGHSAWRLALASKYVDIAIILAESGAKMDNTWFYHDLTVRRSFLSKLQKMSQEKVEAVDYVEAFLLRWKIFVQSLKSFSFICLEDQQCCRKGWQANLQILAWRSSLK